MIYSRYISLLLLTTCLLIGACAPSGFATVEKREYRLWTEFAPDEKDDKKAPRLYLFEPEKQTSDSFVLVCPGGGYNGLAINHEGWEVAQYFNSKGIRAAVLKYRVPRPKGKPKHMAAWQDAQRAVRIIRSNAEEWRINPEKIGILGFSAGGHLSLMLATTSQTPAYEPMDELDKLPCHVNFAIPVYPAYVLENIRDTEKGSKPKLVKDFKFDKKTPPMCFIHGDEDGHSPMGSVAIYHKLRTMKIPAELHIFAKVHHGFGTKPTQDTKNKHVGDWLNRSYEAIKIFGF